MSHGAPVRPCSDEGSSCPGHTQTASLHSLVGVRTTLCKTDIYATGLIGFLFTTSTPSPSITIKTLVCLLEGPGQTAYTADASTAEASANASTQAILSHQAPPASQDAPSGADHGSRFVPGSHIAAVSRPRLRQHRRRAAKQTRDCWWWCSRTRWTSVC